MTLRQWSILMLLALVWGISFFFTAVAVREIDVLFMSAARVSIAALFLIVLCLALRLTWPREPRQYLFFFAIGLLSSALPFSLISYSQTQISSGLASILNSAVPLITVVLSHFWPGEDKATKAKLIGVMIGLCGVTLLFFDTLETSDAGQLFGQLAMIVATICYAFANITVRRHSPLHPLMAAALMSVGASLVLIPLAFIVHGAWVTPAMPSLLALFASGIISTGIAFWLYFTLIHEVGPTNLSLVTFLIPIIGVIVGVVALDETLSSIQIMGMGVIFAGLYFVQSPSVRRSTDYP